MKLQQRITAAARYIRPRIKQVPKVLLVLGSGLGNLAQSIVSQDTFKFEEIPHFKHAGAPGHSGRLIFGKLAGCEVVAMQGRLHAYEGHLPSEIVFPLQVLYELGARTMITTNAAGGINEAFNVGEVMLIKDHINFSGMNPLTLCEDSGMHEFSDMTFAYTPELQEVALQAAEQNEVVLRQGIYLGLRGPSFETPAEIRAFRTWGADAVGMSTVLEVIAAAALGMKVCGLSLISNKAAGMVKQKLSGDDVLEASRLAAAHIEGIIAKMLKITNSQNSN